ncbi:hypothetical protein BTVI_45146 [Pitangus sulphuratus]|nr:hypothetical protein BTVI_45146 [Pitangus sulphuratus]
MAWSDRARGNGLKLMEDKDRSDTKKKAFPVRVVRPWHRLPREAVSVPSLEVFKDSYVAHGSQNHRIAEVGKDLHDHRLKPVTKPHLANQSRALMPSPVIPGTLPGMVTPPKSGSVWMRDLVWALTKCGVAALQALDGSQRSSDRLWLNLLGPNSSRASRPSIKTTLSMAEEQRRLVRNEKMPENTGDDKLHWLAEEIRKEKEGKLRMAKGIHE